MKTANISDESKQLHKLYRDGVIDDQTLEDSMNALALIPPKETALAVYSKPCGLDPYLDNVKDKIAEFKANPPPLNTEKGRKLYASMARKVASFKTALDGLGKELVDELKDVPKKVDAERKRIRELLDEWRDDVRKPLDDWQAEQDAIEAKRVADEAAKALAAQIESDHEIALLLNEKYDREESEAEAKAEQERIAYEARIAAEAAEKAKQEAERVSALEQQRIKDEAAKQAAEAQAAIERAQREKAESEAREKQAKIDAEAREMAQKQAAELATKQAAEKAERDRLQAIADTESRIACEKAQEQAEAEQREKNKAHAKRINNEILQDFMASGLSEECAKTAITAMAKGQVRNVKINY